MPLLPISPLVLLLVALTITLIAVAINAMLRRRRRRDIAELARAWNMHYSPWDMFNLAPRVASRLPIPGASDVAVRDLVYGTEPAGHRYIFLAEFTTGVVRGKRRRQCVVSLFEPRAAGEASVWKLAAEPDSTAQIAEQYQLLRKET